MKKLKFMIIPLIIISLITSYAYNEKEKDDFLEREKSQIDRKIKELEDKNKDLLKIKEVLMNVNKKMELESSNFQNFEIPSDFSLLRYSHFKYDGSRTRYYEYKTDLDKESLITFLRNQIEINNGSIYHEVIDEDNSILFYIEFPVETFDEDDSILYYVEYPIKKTDRTLIVRARTYLNEQHIIFYESNRTEDNSKVSGGPGCMLLYIPMTDGTVKEVLLDEYHIVESCQYNNANSIMKEYHEQLNKNEDSINVNITGEEALNIPVSPIDSNTVWKVQLSEDRLPVKEKERELYLSNLALSILAGHKYIDGDLTFKNVMFINENGKKIKEYKLEDFKGRF